MAVFIRAGSINLEAMSATAFIVTHVPRAKPMIKPIIKEIINL